MPKLTRQVKIEIIKKRNSLPGQRFTSWDQLATISGIGKVLLQTLKVFCQDPATSSVVEERGQPRDSTTGNPVWMMQCKEEADQVIRHDLTTCRLKPFSVWWTQADRYRPGDMYQDSGCNRCIGGEEHDQKWQQY